MALQLFVAKMHVRSKDHLPVWSFYNCLYVHECFETGYDENVLPTTLELLHLNQSLAGTTETQEVRTHIKKNGLVGRW